MTYFQEMMINLSELFSIMINFQLNYLSKKNLVIKN